ncbi:MAG: hypothetical protein PF590_04585 [Candidatus Delongbacteria bacterium]|jgi:hypothetical protein|nr:hypothetical protein [Candidatus Delongbacteria bacterium]
MKKLLLFTLPLLTVVFFSCQNAENENASDADTSCNDEKTEQEATKDKSDINAGCCSETEKSCDDVMTADKLFKNFESYEGKEIKVCGKITHICQHGGKRLFLGTNADNDDVVIVTSEEEFDEKLIAEKVVNTGNVKNIEAYEEAHDHEEDDEHSDDTQHKAAHDNTFVLEASKCKACKCDYEKE